MQRIQGPTQDSPSRVSRKGFSFSRSNETANIYQAIFYSRVFAHVAISSH